MEKNIKNGKIRGFSLIELSVSLSIIGMIVASAISVAVTSDYYTKKAETESKLDRIEESIAGFLQSNLRLPCPASGAVAIGATGFGLDGATNTAGGYLCANKNFTSGNIYAGVVPVRTLQLPDDYMLDGWGRRITYAVDYRFANSQTTNTTCDGTTSTACFVYTASGGISVYADNALSVSRSTAAVYVLLSHGENGHGAFPKNGSATTARINAYDASNPYRSAYTAELENSHFSNTPADTAYNASFVQKDYVRVDDATVAAASREYFDDILRFRTREQVIKAAGKVWYDSGCLDAAAVVGSPGSNSCTGAANEANCESMATEIYSRCLQ